MVCLNVQKYHVKSWQLGVGISKADKSENYWLFTKFAQSSSIRIIIRQVVPTAQLQYFTKYCRLVRLAKLPTSLWGTVVSGMLFLVMANLIAVGNRGAWSVVLSEALEALFLTTAKLIENSSAELVVLCGGYPYSGEL